MNHLILKKPVKNKNLIIAIGVIASPILFALVVFPDSFSLSWNQGRGGFLFALAFIIAELVGLKLGITKQRILAVIPLALLVIAYLISLEYGLREYIVQGAEVYDIQLVLSWIWMWDFIILTAFTITALSIYFGKRWIRIAPAGPIFLGGSALILSLVAFFPCDALGPLQYFVPHLINLNVWLITAFDLGTATARDNLMFLRGDHGPFALQVFWPSAGVHSIIIFSLVMGAFLLKMNIPRCIFFVFFGLLIFFTFNFIFFRIFSLSVYALKVTTNAEQWEEFHSVAGEIMFLPWLFIFLLIVMTIETRRLKKKEAVDKLKSENS